MPTTHQPEPWDAFHLYGAAEGEGYVIRAERPVKSGRHHGRIDSAGQFSKADAERIVVCINYCAGTPTQKLVLGAEHGGLGRVFACHNENVTEIERLTAQRDELLAMLRNLHRPIALLESVTGQRMTEDRDYQAGMRGAADLLAKYATHPTNGN